MKKRFLIICLIIEALLACTGRGFASDLQEFSLSEYKHNFFGSISVDVGTYVDTWQNGKADVQDAFAHTDSAKYFGEYKDRNSNVYAI